jgi:hypothetical protein
MSKITKQVPSSSRITLTRREFLARAASLPFVVSGYATQPRGREATAVERVDVSGDYLVLRTRDGKRFYHNLNYPSPFLGTNPGCVGDEQFQVTKPLKQLVPPQDHTAPTAIPLDDLLRSEQFLLFNGCWATQERGVVLEPIRPADVFHYGCVFYTSAAGYQAETTFEPLRDFMQGEHVAVFTNGWLAENTQVMAAYAGNYFTDESGGTAIVLEIRHPDHISFEAAVPYSLKPGLPNHLSLETSGSNPVQAVISVDGQALISRELENLPSLLCGLGGSTGFAEVRINPAPLALFSHFFSDVSNAPPRAYRQSPLYTLLREDGGAGEYFYTVSFAEACYASSQLGFKRIGVLGFAESEPLPDVTTPLFRFFSPDPSNRSAANRRSFFDHCFTTDQREFDDMRVAGYGLEGIAAYLGTSGMPLVRLNHPDGHHALAGNAIQLDALKRAGYRPEGTIGYIRAVPDPR